MMIKIMHITIFSFLF